MSEPTPHSEFLVRLCRYWDKDASKIEIQSAVWSALDAPQDLVGKFLRDRKVIAQ
jgi:hypothetical protein